MDARGYGRSAHVPVRDPPADRRARHRRPDRHLRRGVRRPRRDRGARPRPADAPRRDVCAADRRLRPRRPATRSDDVPARPVDRRRDGRGASAASPRPSFMFVGRDRRPGRRCSRRSSRSTWPALAPLATVGILIAALPAWLAPPVRWPSRRRPLAQLGVAADDHVRPRLGDVRGSRPGRPARRRPSGSRRASCAWSSDRRARASRRSSARSTGSSPTSPAARSTGTVTRRRPRHADAPAARAGRRRRATSARTRSPGS